VVNKQTKDFQVRLSQSGRDYRNEVNSDTDRLLNQHPVRTVQARPVSALGGGLTQSDVVLLQGVLARLSAHLGGIAPDPSSGLLAPSSQPAPAPRVIEIRPVRKVKKGLDAGSQIRSYALLIGNYNRANIVDGTSWMEKAKDKGYPVFTQQMYERGVPYTGVYSGPFDSRHEAVELMDILNKAKGEKYWDEQSILFAPRSQWQIESIPAPQKMDEDIKASGATAEHLSNGSYIILIGHYRNKVKDYVRLLKKNLQEHDILAYTTEIKVQGIPYTSLFSGPFKTKDEARTALNRLRTEFNTFLGVEKILYKDGNMQ